MKINIHNRNMAVRDRENKERRAIAQADRQEKKNILDKREQEGFIQKVKNYSSHKK